MMLHYDNPQELSYKNTQLLRLPLSDYKKSKTYELENICTYLKQFDTTWLSSFKQSIKTHPDSTRIKASLSSLCQNRNHFAHGKPSTASFNDIIQYFEDSVIVISILDSIVV